MCCGQQDSYHGERRAGVRCQIVLLLTILVAVVGAHVSGATKVKAAHAEAAAKTEAASAEAEAKKAAAEEEADDKAAARHTRSH